MADDLAALSTDPARFGIDQPPDQGQAEIEKMLQGLNAQLAPSRETPFSLGLDKLRLMGSQYGAQSEQAKLAGTPPFGSLKFNSDGTVDASGVPADVVQDLMESRQFHRQVLGGFAQQAAQIQTELQRAQAQPWQQLGTALAANMANQPGMPPWVRGLGATAAQMNPTVDQLRARYLATMGQGAEIAEKGIGLGIAQQRTMEDAAQRRQSVLVAAETHRVKNVESIVDDAAAAIKAGTGDVDTKAIMNDLVNAGATKAELGAKMSQLESLAKNVNKKWTVEREDKTNAEARALESTERSQKYLSLAVTAAAQKTTAKSDEDQAIEIAAQDLAKGGLSTLRDVAGFRGTQRLRLFARIKELNPQFSAAELNRKISMEQSFTVGKDGQGLQSFDTFLQHAGEVTGALENIRLSGSPAFNKPINWMRRNMTGSPELAALEVSLEPVKKEFEKFLLNQQALYAEDRKEAEKMLNSNMSPAQLLAALKQMAKTAKDRYAAMNQRYSRVMKQDIQHPFSGEALAAASTFGIDLGGPAEPKSAKEGTVNVTEEELKKLGFK